MSSEEPSVPQIECAKCETEHHFDAGGLTCKECGAYLREATVEEHEQMGEFMRAQMQGNNE